MTPPVNASLPLYILGIGGTFMGGLAQLAAAAGVSVQGVDQQLYPPMDGQLQRAGIDYQEGYDPAALPENHLLVVGNVMSRGMPVVEAMLDRGLPYTSGPQWLAEHILAGRWVLAVAGTHGKTTTASLLAFILEEAGLAPGFLIGGVPQDFGVSARLGSGPFFVIEADEYDCAFFDKRAKFVHYRPRTLVLNNLEYDHADIYPDLAAIERQFQHGLRMVPGQGRVLVNARDAALQRVLQQGCWTPVTTFATEGPADLQAQALTPDARHFRVLAEGQVVGEVQWRLQGQHNLANALAALAAARHAGVPLAVALPILSRFSGVKRRLEVSGEVAGITVLDDFAHHPTAIALTLQGVRASLASGQRVFAILEPRSNTMRMGVHAQTLGPALQEADAVYLYTPEASAAQIDQLRTDLGERVQHFTGHADLVQAVVTAAQPGDQLLVMSNGGFGGIHQRLLQALRERWHGGT